MSSRSQRAIWSFATSLLFSAVTMATGFMVTPLLLRWLGDERFGAFRTLSAFFAYLTLLELGLGGAVSPLLARALGHGDVARVRQTLVASIRAYGKVTLLVILVGLGLTAAILRGHWIPVPAGDQADLRRACLVSLVGFLTLGLVPFRTLTDARQRSYRLNLLMTLQCVLLAALSLILAHAGWGITGQAVATTTCAFVFYGFVTVMELRPLRGLSGEVLTSRTNPAVLKELWTLSLPTLIINLGGRISLLSDDIVIAGILGLESVAVLFVTQRLAVVGQQQLQHIGAASWSGLAELHARGEHEVFRRRLIELSGMVVILAVAGLAPSIAYNRHFVSLWAGSRRDGGFLVILVASINALIQSLLCLWGWCLSGTGKARLVAVPTVIATVINLSCSILFTFRFGLIGPLLGTLTGLGLVQLWYYPALLRRVFEVSPAALAGAVLRPLAFGIPYTALLCVLARVHTPPGWIGLLLEMATASLVALGVSAAFLLSPTDRDRWKQRLAALRPRRRPAAAAHVPEPSQSVAS